MKKYLSKMFQSWVLGRADERVGLYYWSPNDHRGDENFGDYMSKIIVQNVVEEKYEELDSAIKYSVDGVEDRLLAIGSILHHANDHDVIWGSGVNGKVLGQKLSAVALDVRMVRGPLSREVLLHHDISCPQSYGEPGLLVSEFYGGADVDEKRYPFSLVLNLNDTLLYEDEDYEDEDYIIYPNWSLDRVIERIRASELVVSTSLHGLVIAEAFGIPARHLLSFAEPTFKYIDYYRGTGRSDVQFAHSLSEALDLGGVALPQYDPQAMIDHFPSDVLNQRA